MKKLIILTYRLLLAIVIFSIWVIAFKFAWYVITYNTPSTKYDSSIHNLIAAILGVVGIVKGISWYMKTYHPKGYSGYKGNDFKLEKTYKIDIDFFN